jgi:hypothetical protein
MKRTSSAREPPPSAASHAAPPFGSSSSSLRVLQRLQRPLARACGRGSRGALRAQSWTSASEAGRACPCRGRRRASRRPRRRQARPAPQRAQRLDKPSGLVMGIPDGLLGQLLTGIREVRRSSQVIRHPSGGLGSWAVAAPRPPRGSSARRASAAGLAATAPSARCSARCPATRAALLQERAYARSVRDAACPISTE